jgi:ABC-type polysaccharide/polyol phosphate export permease
MADTPTSRIWAPAGGARDAFWEVLRAISVGEIRERRRLTAAGIAKWMLEPLSYMLVYFLVLGGFFVQPQHAYPLFLLCALVPWRYFTGVVLGSMSIVERNSAIISNRLFPREVLPLVLIMVEGATFLLALSLFVPLLVYYGIFPGVALLWLPVAIAVLVALCAGASYVSAVFGLRFPDVRPAAQNLIRLGFFASAGLVRPSDAPSESLEIVLQANPLTGVFESFRAIFLRADAPQAADLLYPLAIAILLFVIGVPLYRRAQASFAKLI